MNKTSFTCPLCNGLMVSYEGHGGWYVRCDNPCDPQCYENVFGHGKTEAVAYEVAKQKFIKRK